MKSKNFLKYNIISNSKFIIFAITILLFACTKTVLLETVPLESPGNPLRGDGAYMSQSSALDVSTADPIYSKRSKLVDNSMIDRPLEENKRNQNNEEGSTINSILYSCPMHPDITSHDPKDTCPKCHMLINKIVKSELPRLKNLPISPSHQGMNHGGMNNEH